VRENVRQSGGILVSEQDAHCLMGLVRLIYDSVVVGVGKLHRLPEEDYHSIITMVSAEKVNCVKSIRTLP